MSEGTESISQEQYDTLIGKLAEFEKMFGNGLKESVEKLTEDVETFKESTETLQKDVKALQEVEPVEVPEIPTDESIQKMIDETIKPVSESQEKRLDTIEKAPFFKAPAEGNVAPVKKEKDILKGIIRHAFPEVNTDE